MANNLGSSTGASTGSEEVRQKRDRYDWARKRLDEYIKLAAEWVVPEAHDGDYLFRTDEERGMMAAAIAFQLTGERRYAEKVALMLRRLSDPVEGYPRTLRACSNSFVQKGHFFQHMAIPCARYGL